MEKILSIIIPTYNMEKYLNKCLTSLVIDDKELMKLLEVIVIIDGAKDRSSEIAHTYQERYPETFVVIDKENGNYGSCVNRGMKESTGKYVKVLDADDSFDTTNFEKYLTFLASAEYDLILTGYNIVDEKGRIISKRNRCLEKGSYTFDFIASNLIESVFQMHEVTYKTKNIRELNYIQTEGISYTDQEWIFTPMINVKSVYNYPIQIYQYLVGREGQTVDPKVLYKAIPQKLKSCYKLIDTYSTCENLSLAKKAYFDHRIIYLLSVVYEYYLIDNISEVGINEIKLLENYLEKKLPSIYTGLNALRTRRIKIQYIRDWRRYGYQRIPLSVKIYKAIRSIYKIKSN